MMKDVFNFLKIVTTISIVSCGHDANSCPLIKTYLDPVVFVSHS